MTCHAHAQATHRRLHDCRIPLLCSRTHTLSAWRRSKGTGCRRLGERFPVGLGAMSGSLDMLR